MSYMPTFAAFHKAVREIVFQNAPPHMMFTFDVGTPEDASANNRGDLFAQSEDFLIVEVEVNRTRRAGPGVQSPRRVWATVLIGWASKSTHNEIAMLSQLEEVADWFGDKTIGGIRFRQFNPLGSSPLMGFSVQDGSIDCEFELKAMTR